MLVGLAIAVAGIVWYFAATPLVWQAVFAESRPFGEMASGLADLYTPMDWRLQLPLWALLGAGGAVVAAALSLPGPFRRQSPTVQLRAAGIGAIVVGVPLILLGSLAPDGNGWHGIAGSYESEIWGPVLVVGSILLIAGVVAVIVSGSTSPQSRARAAAAVESRQRAVVEAQAAQIRQFEAAYALAHDGQPPQPGYVPPAQILGTAPAGRHNTLAVLSIVLTLVAAGFMGLILGPIALSQIKRTGEGGRGLAIASIVIAAIYLALILVSLVVFAVILRR